MIDHLPEEEAPTGAHNSSNQRNTSNQSNAQNQPKKKVIDAREGLRVARNLLTHSAEFINDVFNLDSKNKDTQRKARTAILREINTVLRSLNTKTTEYAEIKISDISGNSLDRARREWEAFKSIAKMKIWDAFYKLWVSQHDTSYERLLSEFLSDDPTIQEYETLARSSTTSNFVSRVRATTTRLGIVLTPPGTRQLDDFCRSLRLDTPEKIRAARMLGSGITLSRTDIRFLTNAFRDDPETLRSITTYFTTTISAKTLLDTLESSYSAKTLNDVCARMFEKSVGKDIFDGNILQLLVEDNIQIPLGMFVNEEWDKISTLLLQSAELDRLINAPRQENRNKKFIDPDTGLPSSDILKEVLQHDLVGTLFQSQWESPDIAHNYNNLSSGDFLVISDRQLDNWVVEIVDFGTPNDPRVTIRTAGINRHRTYPVPPPWTLELYEFYAFIKQSVAGAPAGKIEYISGQDPALDTELPNVYSDAIREDLMEMGGFNIPTLEKLQELIDKVDADGKAFPVKQGMMFQEKKSPFEIFTIQTLTTAPQSLVVVNSLGQAFSAPPGLDPFTWFFVHFSGASDPNDPSETGSMLYKRISGIADQQSFFAEAIKDPNLKKAFGDLYFDAEQKKFVPNIHADKAATHPGARYFRSKSGAFIQILKTEWDTISFLYSKSIKFTEKDGKSTFSPGTDPIYKQEDASYAFFYRQVKELGINEYQEEPFDTNTEAAHVEHLHEHGGMASLFGAYMRGISFHTIGQAFHHGVHMIKHKLESGNKLQEQEVFFRSMRRILGPNHPLTREARVMADRERDKTFKEYKQEFLDMKGQSLALEAKHFLEQKRFDRFKLIALIFALIEDSGTLYLGAPLQSLRGSEIFFRKLVGEANYDAKKKEYTKKAIDKYGVSNEMLMIQMHLMYLAGEDIAQVPVSFGKAFEYARNDAAKAQYEKGGNEAERDFPSAEKRYRYAIGKLKDGQPSTAAGVMEKIWDKGSPGEAVEMRKLAIVLMMSDATDFIDNSVLVKIPSLFYGGKNHPELLFMGKSDRIGIFRATIGELSKSDPDMLMAFNKIEKARNNKELGLSGDYKGQSDCISLIEKFWDTYGERLHKKLSVADDPEIQYLAENKPNEYPAYVAYWNVLKAQFRLDDTRESEFNPDAKHTETYNDDPPPIELFLLGKRGIRLSPQGRITSDDHKALMDTFKHTYGNIRSREVLSSRKLPDGTYAEFDPVEKQKYVAANMTRVMKVFMQWIDQNNLGRSVTPGVFKNLKWVQDLSALGWPLVKYYKLYHEQYQTNLNTEEEDPIPYTPSIKDEDVKKFISDPDLLQRERTKELIDEQIETGKWASQMVEDIKARAAQIINTPIAQLRNPPQTRGNTRNPGNRSSNPQAEADRILRESSPDVLAAIRDQTMEEYY